MHWPSFDSSALIPLPGRDSAKVGIEEPRLEPVLLLLSRKRDGKIDAQNLVVQ